MAKLAEGGAAVSAESASNYHGSASSIPKKGNWLYSPLFDCAFILSPPFLATAAVLLFPGIFAEGEVSPLAWLVLIVGIDVAHVYSTLYRTYFDRDEFLKRQLLYILVPLACWGIGMMLYSLGDGTFWRVLAYLAVWHFVRQQYGIMRLYTRKDASPSWARMIDTATIYLATLYPLLYWHVTPRNFAWFKQGDFVMLPYPILAELGAALYCSVLVVYLTKELYSLYQTRRFNMGKQLVVLGTALSWYVGIVLYNGDLAFTVTNVICHGIPYIALVWVYGRKKWRAQESRTLSSRIFDARFVPLFIGIVLLLAVIEEFLWDSFIWREHCNELFGLCLPQVEHTMALSILIPLLAVPQATHYVLDAFIWRIRPGEHSVRELL